MDIFIVHKALPHMNLLNRLRTGRGWSMEALARRVNTTASTINKLEKGQMQLTEEWLTRLSDAFDVRKSELLGENQADGGLIETVVRSVLKAYEERGIIRLGSATPDEISEICRHIAETIGKQESDGQTRSAQVEALTGNIVDFAIRKHRE
jgi:transcriptional regulator with XRE-family HTH domain